MSNQRFASLPIRPLLLVVALSCVGCDQATKRLAVEMLKGSGTSTFLADTFRLSYTENPGAFLSLGATWPEPIRWLVFTAISLALAVFGLVWSYQQAKKADHTDFRLWAMVLIVSGGIGNLIDRVFRDGRVIDFMNIGVGSLRTGIFNVADLQIMAGAALLVFGQYFEKRLRTPSSHLTT